MYFYSTEEQLVILDDDMSVKSDTSSHSSKIVRKKQEPTKNKTERDLPAKAKIKGKLCIQYMF